MAKRTQVAETDRKIDAGTGGHPFGAPKQISGGGTKTPLVQRVYQTIMDSLDAGEMPPGSRIVASELAQRLGLSRAPVREALAVLAGKGLVELLPDRGAMLRPMSAHDLAGIYEVSAPVAAIGLEAAAYRIHEGNNAKDVREAMAAIRLAAQEPHPGIGFFLLLNEFHYLVNGIAEKPYVTLILGAVNIEYWNRLLVARIDLETHAARYADNYQRITDALLAGDGGSARAAMMFHANWCITLILE